MLWTDGYPISDLNELDADASSVAAGEENAISLTNVANLAYSECSSLLREAITGSGIASCSGVSDAHLELLYSVSRHYDIVRHRYDLMHIVSKVGPEYSDIQRWYGYTALVGLYRQAYSSQASDRYQAKILLNDAEARKAWYRITANGIPMAVSPLSRPGAKFDQYAGTWTSANLTQIASPGATGGTFYIAISWVAGSVESSLSEAVQVVISADNVLRVSIASLTPPSGSAPSIYQGVTFPVGKATGWNVYAGSSATALFKQTPSPVDIVTTTYDFSAAPVLSGLAPGYGQRPDVFSRVLRFLQRA